jgi:hypothetical protein
VSYVCHTGSKFFLKNSEFQVNDMQGILRWNHLSEISLDDMEVHAGRHKVGRAGDMTAAVEGEGRRVGPRGRIAVSGRMRSCEGRWRRGGRWVGGCIEGSGDGNVPLPKSSPHLSPPSLIFTCSHCRHGVCLCTNKQKTAPRAESPFLYSLCEGKSMREFVLFPGTGKVRFPRGRFSPRRRSEKENQATFCALNVLFFFPFFSYPCVF